MPRPPQINAYLMAFRVIAVIVTGGTLGWSIPVTNVPWRTLKPRKGDFWITQSCLRLHKRHLDKLFKTSRGTKLLPSQMRDIPKLQNWVCGELLHNSLPRTEFVLI